MSHGEHTRASDEIIETKAAWSGGKEKTTIIVASVRL